MVGKEANCAMKIPKPSAVVDIPSLARFILSADCTSVVLLTGAGVSVASGIPDFRSPGGMYDTLRPELITATPQQRRLMLRDPASVVSWDVFSQTAFPYLEVRRPFILGTRERRWRATIAHRFAELLHIKTGKLTRIYTQNIDGLDQQCDKIPADRIVAVHGTLSRAACEGCGFLVDYDDFCEQVRTNIKDIYAGGDDIDDDDGDGNDRPGGNRESKPILCPGCHKPLVKPTTVLFGRNLPAEFFARAEQDLPKVDLLIVAGTSLVVSPANSLVYRVPESAVRVVANTDPVGEELGIEYAEVTKRDYFAQGECDTVFLNLIRELGWLDDLKAQADLLPQKSQQLLQTVDD